MLCLEYSVVFEIAKYGVRVFENWARGIRIDEVENDDEDAASTLTRFLSLLSLSLSLSGFALSLSSRLLFNIFEKKMIYDLGKGKICNFSFLGQEGPHLNLAFCSAAHFCFNVNDN